MSVGNEYLYTNLKNWLLKNEPLLYNDNHSKSDNDSRTRQAYPDSNCND